MNDFKRVRTSNQFYNARNVTFVVFGNLAMLFCSTETSDFLRNVFYLWRNLKFFNIQTTVHLCRRPLSLFYTAELMCSPIMDTSRTSWTQLTDICRSDLSLHTRCTIIRAYVSSQRLILLMIRHFLDDTTRNEHAKASLRR